MPLSQCELKTLPCHTLASWLVTIVYTIAIGVAIGEVASEQCSAGKLSRSLLYAGCDRLMTSTSIFTHMTLRGATKKRYIDIVEDSSQHYCCLLGHNFGQDPIVKSGG